MLLKSLACKFDPASSAHKPAHADTSSMKPIRLTVAANNTEDTDPEGVAASPRFFSNVFTGGRHRKLSISGESLGCLALLDGGGQIERPHVFPNSGELLPAYVKAQPTVHVHRPRAVLSSPENDGLACDLQGHQGVKLTSFSSAPKAVLSPSEDLPHAPLSSFEDLGPILSSNAVSRVIPSPPKDLLSMGARDTFVSDETASCSTSSNQDHVDESNELTNAPVDIKQNRSLPSAATKEKEIKNGLFAESWFVKSDNDENLSSTAVNRVVKKHSGLPSNTSHGPAKQLPKPVSKGKSVRVLRPWY